MENSLLSERLAVLGVLDSLVSNNGTRSTGWIDMSLCERLIGIFSLGATDTTVDLFVEQATDSSGTGAATLKSATQRSATDDNSQVLINVRESELTQGNRYVRFRATVGNGSTGASIAAVILGGDVHYGQPKGQNLASVLQVLN